MCQVADDKSLSNELTKLLGNETRYKGVILKNRSCFDELIVQDFIFFFSITFLGILVLF
jgi:hypothetical protein